MGRPPSPSSDLSRHSRRFVFSTIGLAFLGVLAGCLGDDDSLSFDEADEELPDPVSIEDGESCDACGMIITHHPGPDGLAFYNADVSLDHPGPSRFCSMSCTYGWAFEEDEDGNRPLVIYSTDYSTVEWELSAEADVTFISAHHEADAFADVRDLTMVAGSDVFGAMGEELIGFSDTADAETFQDDHGGELVEHEDISRELIDSLGGM